MNTGFRGVAGRVAATILAFAVLAGCATSRPIEPGLVRDEAPMMDSTPVIAAHQGEYVLRPADVIKIDVFREQDLSLPSVAVAADGKVSFPLLGPVEVAGRTAGGLESFLEAELGARYLRDPDVSVNVLDYASHQVTVEGAVQEPGIFAFRPGTRLSGGVALAKGATRVAALREVAIFRPVEGGTQVAKFDLAAVRAGTMLDPVLQPGDRIVVGTDNLAQFWQDFLRALPAFGLFTQL